MFSDCEICKPIMKIVEDMGTDGIGRQVVGLSFDNMLKAIDDIFVHFSFDNSAVLKHFIECNTAATLHEILKPSVAISFVERFCASMYMFDAINREECVSLRTELYDRYLNDGNIKIAEVDDD